MLNRVPRKPHTPPLGVVIVVMMLPLVWIFGLGNGGTLLPYVLGAYLCQVAVLIVYFLSSGARLPHSFAFAFVAFGIAQYASLTSGLIITHSMNPMDFANVLAKLLGFLLLVGLMSTVQLDWPVMSRLFRLIVLLALVASAFALIRTGGQVSQIFSLQSSYELSFRGFFGNRNQFGAYLFISIVAHFLILGRQRASFGSFVVLGVQFVALALTMSRGAMLATVVFVVALAMMRRLLLTGLTLAAFGGVLVGGIVAVNSVWFAPIRRLLVREDAGISGRGELWARGWEVFSTSPVFGVGAFRAVELAQAEGMAQSQFHSFYVETLAGGGIVELLVVGGLLIISFGRSVRASRICPEGRVYVAAFLGLFVLLAFESIGFLSMGYVDTIFTVMFISLPLMAFGASSDGPRT